MKLVTRTAYIKLAEQDVDMAVSAAVKDTSLQTMALHGDNKMLAEESGSALLDLEMLSSAER